MNSRVYAGITIIGGGIAGSVAAWVLSELGFLVTIIEQKNEIFDGTSRWAAAGLLGGHYAKSPETAEECTRSAILMKRLMPWAFSGETLRFLIAKSDDPQWTSEVDFETYHRFYDHLREYYASLVKKSPLNEVFGSPETFFRIMKPSEYKNFSNIEGALETQEPGFDMESTRKVLLKTLNNNNVHLITNTKVQRLFHNDDGTFLLELSDPLGNNRSEVITSTLINAAGYAARNLGQMIGDKPAIAAQWRCFNTVEITPDIYELYPYSFVVAVGDFMNYTLKKDKRHANLIFYNDFEKIYIPEGESIDNREKWDNSLLYEVVPEQDRPQKMINFAREHFMKELPYTAHSVGSYPGIAVWFSQYQENKTQPHVSEEISGYFRLIPTKSTHAIRIALEVANILMRERNHLSLYQEQVLRGEHIRYIS